MHEPEDILQGRNVLLVDDDPRNIFALYSYLAGIGMEIYTAENGIQALNFLEKHPETDIVLMDMMMPDTDGYEAIRQLKASEQFREIPMIAVTAQAMPGDREKCLEAGADDYISKPIDVDLLVRILSSHL